jgi:ribosome-associated protein
MNLPDLDSELEFSFSKSSGPGGQNVNKVETKVELRFNIGKSKLLNFEQKNKLLDKLSNKITTDTEILIVIQEKRSQLKNKEISKKKFYSMLEKAFAVVKERKATKPSKAAVEERIKAKKISAERKSTRAKPIDF